MTTQNIEVKEISNLQAGNQSYCFLIFTMTDLMVASALLQLLERV